VDGIPFDSKGQCFLHLKHQIGIKENAGRVEDSLGILSSLCKGGTDARQQRVELGRYEHGFGSEQCHGVHAGFKGWRVGLFEGRVGIFQEVVSQ